MDASEVTRRMVAAYEAGEMVTSCAWCGRVVFGRRMGSGTAGCTARDRCPQHVVAFDLSGVQYVSRRTSGPLIACAARVLPPALITRRRGFSRSQLCEIARPLPQLVAIT